MDSSISKRDKSRRVRVFRVRRNLKGTSEKPRLSVSRTNQHLYVQLIDDEKGITLGGFGTLSKASQAKRKSKTSAKEIGEQIAKIAKQKNIQAVVFDRGRYKYHGVIAQLAESAREAGLQF